MYQSVRASEERKTKHQGKPIVQLFNFKLIRIQRVFGGNDDYSTLNWVENESEMRELWKHQLGKDGKRVNTSHS